MLAIFWRVSGLAVMGFQPRALVLEFDNICGLRERSTWVRHVEIAVGCEAFTEGWGRADQFAPVLRVQIVRQRVADHPGVLGNQRVGRRDGGLGAVVALALVGIFDTWCSGQIPACICSNPSTESLGVVTVCTSRVGAADWLETTDWTMPVAR